MITAKKKLRDLEEIANIVFSVKLSFQTLDILMENSKDVFNDEEERLLADVINMLKQKTRREERKIQSHL